MLVFIARRLVVSLFVLFAASFVMFVLAANVGDPLADLRELPEDAQESAMAERIERMHLDLPVYARYFLWLGAALTGDLGTNRQGQDVNILLADAISATMQLVVAATVLAIVIGIAIGIISALRQYSGFDHTVTFGAFVAFSLPIFWVGVLLKQYGAIEFNNWLAQPVIPPLVIGVVALLAGLAWSSLMVGDRRTRLIAFAGATAVTAALLAFISLTRWFADPGLGPVTVAISALGAAVGFSVLISGPKPNRPMYAALTAAGVGTVMYFVLSPVLDAPDLATIAGLALTTVVVCVAIGYGVGGVLHRRNAIATAVWTGLFTGGVIFVDRMLQSFASYSSSVQGRPISTVGASTPNYEGTFWELSLDSAGHLALPTMALILVSLATYTRYSRASMLEVMNQDYVRTARAKGLPERTVMTRHAFRNGLIPITTLAAYDFGTVIGGAVVTETVFGWRAMGHLLITGLNEADPTPVMAFFVVASGAIVIFNMIADITYAYLDPRIRLS
ncbi:ABC transporter permease [Nocardiopsis metallicus]|uniref:Peptide/nickel transport system permease protein n=1 Tax=Nocardiopsis metallicus TaxID=179819 RepID=A0A840VYI6_9ACTN|nr:ABC transporter permease [Nocardiopsis metallicus]MBB5489560.1 peptide/nickel transport system permease protein [Nocardiopsis metallicus]